MQGDGDFEKNLEALTPEKVNVAMQKYMGYSKLSIIKAGDCSKRKTKQTKDTTPGFLVEVRRNDWLITNLNAGPQN